MPLIRVAAVVLTDDENRVLTVRKRGTERFMLPGGKPEPGESFLETAIREVREELGLELRPDALEPLAQFMSAAANEPGHELESHVFTYLPTLVQEPRVAAEIEELCWFTEAELRYPAPGVLLAPMLQFDAVPAVFGTPPTDVATAYRMLHARVHGGPPEGGARALSVAQYDAARRDHLTEHAIVSTSGVAIWPPTSQTLMKQLGDGSWASAMHRLGLTTPQGRARGTGSISDETYTESVTQFLKAARDETRTDVTSDSFAQFTAWLASEKSAGKKWPSAAGVRRHFGSWDAAKHAARESL